MNTYVMALSLNIAHDDYEAVEDVLAEWPEILDALYLDTIDADQAIYAVAFETAEVPEEYVLRFIQEVVQEHPSVGDGVIHPGYGPRPLAVGETIDDAIGSVEHAFANGDI